MLREDSKQLIRLIYPAASDDRGDKINISPNPVADEFTIEIQGKNKEMFIIQLTDLNGKIIKQQTAEISEGINAIKIMIPEVEQGIYLVNFYSVAGQGIKKLVKL